VPEQLAAGPGGATFAFDKGMIGDSGSEGLAPTKAFLQSLPGGGHGHGVKPPALLGGEGLPIPQSIRDVVRWRAFNCPAEYAEFRPSCANCRHRRCPEAFQPGPFLLALLGNLNANGLGVQAVGGGNGHRAEGPAPA